MRDYQEGARTVVAGLRLLREHAKRAGLQVTTMDLLYHAESRIADEITPWEPEPGPSAERKWSEVIPGDRVLAPNGTWYPVESIARIGNEVRALLLSGDAKIPTTRRADEVVKVERGDAGRAVDVFAAGGITLEPIGAGK